MKRISIFLLLLFLVSCSNQNVPKPTPNPTPVPTPVPTITPSQVTEVKMKIANIFNNAGKDTPSIDFRCKDPRSLKESIYHIIAKCGDEKYIYRYCLSNNTLFEEAVYDSNGHYLLPISSDPNLLQSYATLGVETPTWLSEEEYENIAIYDRIPEY